MADIITLDPARFRTAFPAFKNAIVFPDAMLTVQWDMAGCYISDRNCGCVRPDGSSCRETVLWLLLAHLLQLGSLGGGGGIVSGASIDKVSVTLVAPPADSAWDWWLNQTPYGAQLLALLSMRAVGGFYAGGLPETQAFRKIGGITGSGFYGGGRNGC